MVQIENLQAHVRHACCTACQLRIYITIKPTHDFVPPAPQGRAWPVFGCELFAGLLGTCAHGSVSDVTTQAMRAPTPWAVVSVADILSAEQAPSTPAAGST